MNLAPKPSSVTRAAGTVIAAALPVRLPKRTAVQAAAVGATDVGARRIDSKGIFVVTVSTDEDTHPAVRVLANEALPTLTWIGANLLASKATRRVRGPRIVKALVAGALVYAADHAMNEWLAVLTEKTKGLDPQPG